MKRITLVIALLMVIGCRKDLEVDTADHLYNYIDNVGIIQKSDIYFYEHLTHGSARVTNSPDSVKTNLRMSYDYQKFAYKNENGIVKIVDRFGNLIEKLSDYTNVKSYGWSADSQTLWMLNNNEIVFYGPEMDIPDLTFPDLSNGEYPMIDVDMLAISSTGDLAYVATYEWYLGEGSMDYASSFIRKPNDGTNGMIDISVQNHTNHHYNELRYAPFSQDLVVLYNASNNTKKIRLYKGDKIAHEHEYIKNGDLTNPIYRPELKYFIYSQPVEYAKLHPRFHIENLLTGEIETFNSIISYNSTLSIDWK